VINGRSYSEGEIVRLPRGSAPVRVRVQKITDGTVELQYDNQIILAKLRRDQIDPKKQAEEELLSLDER
jgi:hypothetical protein